MKAGLRHRGRAFVIVEPTWEDALFSPVRDSGRNGKTVATPADLEAFRIHLRLNTSRCLRCLHHSTDPQRPSPRGILTAANSRHVANAHVEIAAPIIIPLGSPRGSKVLAPSSDPSQTSYLGVEVVNRRRESTLTLTELH